MMAGHHCALGLWTRGGQCGVPVPLGYHSAFWLWLLRLHVWEWWHMMLCYELTTCLNPMRCALALIGVRAALRCHCMGSLGIASECFQGNECLLSPSPLVFREGAWVIARKCTLLCNVAVFSFTRRLEIELLIGAPASETGEAAC